MEENSFTALTPVQDEINTYEGYINSSSSPESVLTTESDLDKLSSELFQKLLFSTTLYTILNCVGVLGNLFVFLVYLKKFKISATRVFVVVMAVCDFVVNLSAIPVHLVYYRHMYTISSPDFCTITYLVLRIPVYVSCMVLGCAILDRRRRVCQPLRQQLNSRQAIFTLVVPFILTAIATLPFVAFYTGMRFKTTTGVTVRKCCFQKDFPGDFFKRAEGILLAVYCIVGLTLLVGAYGHILYRVKKQSKKLNNNLTCNVLQPGTLSSMMSSSISGRRSEEEVEHTRDGCGESLDQEGYVTWVERGSRELTAEQPRVSASPVVPARRGMSVGVYQSKKLLTSKTTLVLFVLTITTVICLTPYIIWTAFPETVYEPSQNPWVMSLSVTCVYLPTLRSTINPFIFLYFNPEFRSHCRQFLSIAISYFHQ